MKRVVTIGEALIDFIPKEINTALKDVETFKRAPGGAPANVAAGVSKLGGNSAFIGMVGEDAFGDFLIETLAKNGVSTQYIKTTKDALTALAFVSLDQSGNRDFSFYRNPSADMLLDAKDIDAEWLTQNDILHFCSVSLIDAPIKDAHNKAIELLKTKNGLISFDPNVRLCLWPNKQALKDTINVFLPLSNIVKVSNDELGFITGILDEEEAIKSLFVGDVIHVIYTKGSNGSEWWTNKEKIASVEAKKVKAIDTTGAGDAFIAAILFKLSSREEAITKAFALECLNFASQAAAYTVTKSGAMSALPTMNALYNEKTPTD